MKTSTRYTLIIFGIIVFFVIAPLLILYVSGTKLNLNDRDTSATGILDAKSNPGGANLKISDEDRGSTPAIARFLTQGEYKVTLSKEGYYDWVKNLPIEPGKVTYAQVGVDEVQLIKKAVPEIITPSGVSSFVLVDDNIWYGSGNNIIKATVDSPNNQTVIPLPAGISKPTLTLLRDKHHIYIGSGNIINTNDNSIIKIPINTGIEMPDNIAVSPNNIFIYSDGQFLNSYDPKTQKVTRLIENEVRAFTMLGDTGYFIENLNASTNESNIVTAVWDGSKFKDFQVLISKQYIGKVPNYLYITDGKALFCNCAASLYKVNQQFDQVSSNILAAHLDLTTNELEYRTPSELWFYNFLANQPQLITRTAGGVNDFMIRSAIGYGFVAAANGLEAIEIDNRDKQNRYQLLNDKTVWQVAMTINQKTIVALQDGALIKIDIRN